MNTVEIGNGYYFLYIAIALAYVLTLVFTLRKASPKTARTVLLVILFLNFSLHFIKQFFEPYRNDFPYSLRRSTFENICGVSTMVFPFIFLIKKHNVLHDFMYFIGMCGGLGALFYPTEAIGRAPFVFDTLRFYVCHINLAAVPLTAAIIGLHRPRLRAWPYIPLIFIAWETLICMNELVLVGAGAVPGATIADLLNPGFRNTSFVFGVRPDFGWAKNVFDPFVPKFLRTDAFNLNGGTPFYFPVLWLVIPSFVFLIPIYLVISSPFWIYTLITARAAKRSEQPQNP